MRTAASAFRDAAAATWTNRTQSQNTQVELPGKNRGTACPRRYHNDLAPDGSLPPFAVSLLDACQSAWVFGGMGSWNDLAFQGDVQAEYECTSERLFLALNEVIPAAANASSIAAG